MKNKIVDIPSVLKALESCNVFHIPFLGDKYDEVVMDAITELKDAELSVAVANKVLSVSHHGKTKQT